MLHVAMTRLDDDGVDGSTTRKVADGADTSVPAVYERFAATATSSGEVFGTATRAGSAPRRIRGSSPDPPYAAALDGLGTSESSK